MRYKWLVTNGDVGTDGNAIFYYSIHANGRRALIKRIEEMVDRTGRSSWAVKWNDLNDPDFREPNKYYRRWPN
jgi:hypothetical protein